MTNQPHICTRYGSHVPESERYTSCCDCGTLLHIANANYEDSDEDEERP